LNGCIFEIAMLMSSTRGEFSGRRYDAAKIGIPIERRSHDGVRIEAHGIETISRHLARFGSDDANDLMLGRLRQIVQRGMTATAQDVAFYAHELRECERYTALGFPDGQPASLDEAYEVWNNAHTATLEEFGVRNERVDLYHPDAQAILRGRGDL
jgi:hypothetical protein